MKKLDLLFTALCSIVLLVIPRLSESTSTFHFFFTLILIPVFCVIIGGYSGWNCRTRWFIPLIPVAASFLIALPFGDFLASQTVLYSGFLLLLGFVAMGLMAMVRSFARQR